MIFQFPYLTRSSPSKPRRIHNNAVIFHSSANFPLYKFQGVILDPPHLPLRNSRQRTVFTCPHHRRSTTVYMSHMRAGQSRRHSCSSGIPKQVQNFRCLLSRLWGLTRNPLPIYRLLRKYSRVLKICWPQVKSYLSITDHPLNRRFLSKVPSFSFKCRICFFPYFNVAFIPNRPRLRSCNHILSPPFQLRSFP